MAKQKKAIDVSGLKLDSAPAPLWDCQKFEGPGVHVDQQYSKEYKNISDSCHYEGFHSCFGSFRSGVPESDKGIGEESNGFPEHVHMKKGVCHN